MRWRPLICVAVGLLGVHAGAHADEIRVSPGGTIQTAIDAAMPGDIVIVEAGTYSEALSTVRDGNQGAPITLRGEGSVEVTTSGRVLRVDHAYFAVEGIVFDGQYGDRDAINIGDGGDFFSLTSSEVRRTSRDCVDMGAPEGVTIDNSLIHHCLNAAGGRTDAHGVVGGAVQNLTIRNTEIHSFSGDAIQFDPGRADPGWNNIVIDGCTLWLEPLPAATNGFAAGVVPGENAIDTKTSNNAPRASITITNTTAYGFRNGLISNMAAFNMKENIDATLDRITVYDSEIAFRVRGPTSTRPAGSHVLVSNAVVYDVDTAVRYEDDIENLRIQHVSFGGDIGQFFDEASSGASVIDVRNNLVLGAALPAEASDPSNLAVDTSVFVDAALHNYHLVMGASAVDTAVAIASIQYDRDGIARPQGSAADIGAYELCPSQCQTLPDAGSGGGADAGSAPNEDDESGGCGCRAAGSTSSGLLVVLVVLLGLRRRRYSLAR